MVLFTLLAIVIVPLSIPLIAIFNSRMKSPLNCNSKNQCIYENMGEVTRNGKTMVAMGCVFCGNRMDVDKDEAEVIGKMSIYAMENRFRSRVIVGNE